MSRKLVLSSLLTLVLLGGTAAYGQTEMPTRPGLPVTGLDNLAPPTTGMTPPYIVAAGPITGASLPTKEYVSPAAPWATYNQIGSAGPVGGDGPIGTDLYMRSGTYVGLGGGVLNDALHDAFTIGVGGRSVFFNPAGDAAWIIDGHIQWVHNYAKDNAEPIFFRENAWKIQSLQRTYVGLGLGKDWYFNGPGYAPVSGRNIGFGVDGGLRLATTHVGLIALENSSVFDRSQAFIGSTYTAAHVDWFRPMGGWIFHVGLRLEYQFTWSNVLPGISSNNHDLGIMGTFGVRF